MVIASTFTIAVTCSDRATNFSDRSKLNYVIRDGVSMLVSVFQEAHLAVHFQVGFLDFR